LPVPACLFALDSKLSYVSLQSTSRVSEMHIDHNGVCFVTITLYVQEFVGSAFNISCSFVMLSVRMYLNTWKENLILPSSCIIHAQFRKNTCERGRSMCFFCSHRLHIDYIC